MSFVHRNGYVSADDAYCWDRDHEPTAADEREQAIIEGRFAEVAAALEEGDLIQARPGIIAADARALDRELRRRGLALQDDGGWYVVGLVAEVEPLS